MSSGWKRRFFETAQELNALHALGLSVSSLNPTNVRYLVDLVGLSWRNLSNPASALSLKHGFYAGIASGAYRGMPAGERPTFR